MPDDQSPERGGLVRRALRRMRHATRLDDAPNAVLERIEGARSLVDLMSLSRLDAPTALAVLETGVDRIAEALLDQDAAARDLSRIVSAAGGLERPDVFMAVLRHSPFLDGSLPLLMEPALRGGSLRLTESLREHCLNTLTQLTVELVQLRDETLPPPPSGGDPLSWLEPLLEAEDSTGLLTLLKDDSPQSEALDRALLFSYGLFLQATLLRHATGLVRTLLLPPEADR